MPEVGGEGRERRGEKGGGLLNVSDVSSDGGGGGGGGEKVQDVPPSPVASAAQPLLVRVEAIVHT